MTPTVVVVDPSGAEWSVGRQWFSRRPRRHRERRRPTLAGLRADWDIGDIVVLPLAVLGLPQALLDIGILAAAILALTIVVPTWLLSSAVGWPWPAAGIVWLLALAAITLGHPLLRVPFRRPWLVVAIQAGQPWADRSAWHVRGWRRSRDAVQSVADAVRSGRGPYLSAEFLL